MTSVSTYKNDTVIIVIEKATKRERELITEAKRIEANVGEELDEKALIFANFKCNQKHSIPAPPVGMEIPSEEEIKRIVEDARQRTKELIEHPELFADTLDGDLSEFVEIYNPDEDSDV